MTRPGIFSLFTVAAALAAQPALGQVSLEGCDAFLGSPANPNQEFVVKIHCLQTVFEDGVALHFVAETMPPEHEDEVVWSAVTRWGTVEPDEGAGPTFDVVFEDTASASGCRWLAVRAGDRMPDEPEMAEEIRAVTQPAGQPDCIPDIFIGPGEDCWETNDCATKSSFCEFPIPAGFFGSGSKSFGGEIPLKGVDLAPPDPTYPEYYPEMNTDTRLNRGEEMFFPGLSIQKAPLDLSFLHLESCQPVVVQFDDGTSKSFDVEVLRSEFPPMKEFEIVQGEIIVTRSHDGGGSFESEFPVHVKYVFREVGTGMEHIFDTGDPTWELPPIRQKTSGNAPWVSEFEPDPEDPDPPLLCSPDFFPGIQTTTNSGPELKKCCKPVGHASGQGHLHQTGISCSACPEGACFDKATLTCFIAAKVEDCEDPVLYPDRKFLGPGTDCRDSDGDLLVDWVEKGSCCLTGTVTQNLCNSLSSRFKADTDNDGIDDAQELLMGRDPCTPEPPPP